MTYDSSRELIMFTFRFDKGVPRCHSRRSFSGPGLSAGKAGAYF